MNPFKGFHVSKYEFVVGFIYIGLVLYVGVCFGLMLFK